MRVFVAGATGVVGRQLVPQLIEAGHQVTATTRSPGKLAGLRQQGAEAVVVDGLDAVAVGQAVARSEPEIVIHQMTALAGDFDLRHFDRTFAATNALRTAGTGHLLAAAEAAGARRVIAQSYAGWTASPTGGPVKTEDDPLDPDPPRAMRPALKAIRYLEHAVASSPLEGVVLRYGSLYGPGATDLMVDQLRQRKVPVIGDGAGMWSFLHVQDAASAAVAALGDAAPGVYNVTDDEPAPVSQWLPVLAAAVGAKPPLRVPAWIGRLVAGEVAVSVMTKVRGASNAKARRELGWELAWPTWRDGFARGLHSVASRIP
ncbi:MAG: NAD-dependent epimerase/dehydratase family protein [Streptosporangiaceae bacterium]